MKFAQSPSSVNPGKKCIAAEQGSFFFGKQRIAYVQEDARKNEARIFFFKNHVARLLEW
jgi:hypothetical protein